MPIEERFLVVVFRANHHPLAEPSKTELTQLRKAIEAYEAERASSTPTEEAIIEAVAQAIHDTDGFCDTVWPDGKGDDGYRGGGYVKLCLDPEPYRRAAMSAIARYRQMKGLD